MTLEMNDRETVVVTLGLSLLALHALEGIGEDSDPPVQYPRVPENMMQVAFNLFCKLAAEIENINKRNESQETAGTRDLEQSS